MTVGCSFIGWNIQETIAFTIKHYQSFCDRVTYFDNFSSDLSRDIAQELGAEVKTFGRPGVLDDAEYIKLKNNCWKASLFDYEIICDDDEILHHPDLKFVLRESLMNGATIFHTQGFGMYSESMPVNGWTDIQTGVKDNKYSKSVIFSPSKIKEIGFVYGCHEAKPVGTLNYSEHTLPLLHYMAVGGPERMIARHAMYSKRLSEINLRWGMGKEYAYSPESKRQWFAEQSAKSAHLSVVGFA